MKSTYWQFGTVSRKPDAPDVQTESAGRKLRMAVAAILFCSGAGVGAQPFAALPDPIPPVIPFGGAMAELEEVASGFASPVTAAAAPHHEDTLFVGDQTGQIRAVDVKKRGRELFADLSGRMIVVGLPGFKYYDERGLLGPAFHPDFRRNGLFYTYTSEPVTRPADFSTMPPGVAPNCQNVLAEWRVMDPKAEPKHVGQMRRGSESQD